jgi:transaldolase
MDPENSTLTASKTASDLTVKIFADGAELESCRALAADPLIQGFTTNPTLMHKVGISDYEGFARELLQIVPDRPISFEVFSDEHREMERQAIKIAGWGDNVYVKIPVTNTRAETTEPLLRKLVAAGVQVNVTGLMTLDQVERVADAVGGPVASNISVFAGRIADTGIDPLPVMVQALEIMADAAPRSELIWASPRELLNVVQADEIGCHIITVTHDLLKKLPLLGKDHDQYSLETVKMFHDDAAAAGFTL